jgi:Circadian oscillating protein COP23
MNKQITILLAAGLLAATAVILPPVTAQTKATFYCGSTYDPTSKTNVPTTLIAMPGRENPFGLIRWKSEYFLKNTAKERCGTVSKKFQAAYTAGKLNFLATGKDRKTGQPVVCALKSESEQCTGGSNILFTLKPYSSSKLVLKQLTGIVTGEGNDPLYQSSADGEVINMQVLFQSAR